MSCEAGTDRALACTAALASLPGMGPARLGAVLSSVGAEEGWSRARSGTLAAVPAVGEALGPAAGDLPRAWAARAASIRPADLLAVHRSLGVGITAVGCPGYPARLADDPEPPALLTWRGDLALLDRPAVAVVGTRSCTREGARVAAALGADLLERGCSVVSGLALGIDAAAHRGALAALADTEPAATPWTAAGGVVGVVATGLDVVYPPANHRLWHDVAARGLLVSEAPLGTRPERWRFPARNRIVAALSHVVVVVESGERGGSMHTVDAAIERGRTVMAVPGPVGSRASRGTNALLADQALVCRDGSDVAVALGLAGCPAAGRTTRSPAHRPVPHGPHAAVLGAVGWTPTPVDELLCTTGMALAPLLACLQELAADGHVEGEGGWWCRVGEQRP